MDQNQYGTPAWLGPREQRLEARVPHGHWKTLTFIAALRNDALTRLGLSTDQSMAKSSPPM
jgi:hypothetical protein